MTDETPEEHFETLEESEEPLEPREETLPGEGGEEETPTKPCLFCGATIDRRSKACPECTHALGPFEPTTPKEYYRFFFAGFLLFMSAFLPCGPGGPLSITTLLGSTYAIIGLGVMWNMWKAIYAGRVKLFWVLMTLMPLIVGIWRIATAFGGDPDDPNSSVSMMAAHGLTGWSSLGDFFGGTPRWGVLRNFFWVLGYSTVFATVGALLAWIFFIRGFFGGIKHSKQQSTSGERSRARARKR